MELLPCKWCKKLGPPTVDGKAGYCKRCGNRGIAAIWVFNLLMLPFFIASMGGAIVLVIPLIFFFGFWALVFGALTSRPQPQQTTVVQNYDNRSVTVINPATQQPLDKK